MPPIVHTPNVTVSPRMPRMMPMAPRMSSTNPSVLAGTLSFTGGSGANGGAVRMLAIGSGGSSPHRRRGGGGGSGRLGNKGRDHVIDVSASDQEQQDDGGNRDEEHVSEQ